MRRPFGRSSRSFHVLHRFSQGVVSGDSKEIAPSPGKETIVLDEETPLWEPERRFSGNVPPEHPPPLPSLHPAPLPLPSSPPPRLSLASTPLSPTRKEPVLLNTELLRANPKGVLIETYPPPPAHCNPS